MRERLQTVALAAAALVLFYVLLFPKPAPPDAAPALPLSDESRPEGYLAVWRWLGSQGIPESSLRYRYDRLAELRIPPNGNLLLVTLPQQVPARSGELIDLENWIERGNTLLIMAALDDAPGWSVGGDPLFRERIERFTGLSFHQAPKKGHSNTSPQGKAERDPNAQRTANAKMATPEPEKRDRLSIEPRGDHPLFAGVRHITAMPPSPAPVGHLGAGVDGMPLVLAARQSDHEPVAWLERRGAGQIILFTVASPFSNAGIALDDNARLLANLIAGSRAPGGSVIFDDAHQGATAYYDGKAFFSDPRLHRTLLWVILLWLAFVVGSQPLRIARQDWQPADEAAYVEASGRYLAAVVPPAEAGERLIDEFLAELRARSRLKRQVSIWDWLDAQAGVSAAERRTLRASYARACAGERVDLVRLQNLLAELRRKLR